MSRLLPLLVCLIALAGCHHDDDSRQKPATSGRPKDEVALSADSSKRSYIQETKLELTARPLMEPVPGKVAYNELKTARITSPLAGRVVSPLAALGDPVQAGAPLVELDSPELGQAKEDYANALADQRLAEAAYKRAKILYEGSVLPRRELQQAEDNVNRARNEARRTLMRLRNLKIEDTRLDNHFLLRTPIAGVVTERRINPGMEVRPDLPDPLFVVSDLNALWVLMNVFEKDLGLIHVGQKVLASVPAYPGVAFAGVIEYIDKIVDETTRTVKVRCAVNNPDGRLLPAMYATVEVQSEADDRVIVVPLSALFTEGETDQVFVALGNGRYKRREVQVGLRLKDRAVILSGLQPGETIVGQGALMLRTEEANAEEAEPDSRD